MFYQDLKFPKVEGRPFFYTNFVSTIDGKVAVKKTGYWPIGSKADYDVLIELRSYADCLIHGGTLGQEFGEVTRLSLQKDNFIKLRKKLGKNPNLPYLIISRKREGANVFHLEGGIASHLIPYLKEKGYKNVLVEGGPTLLGSFLKENLMDELFLTISPKIYGSDETTKNLVEGQLFPPDQIKHLKLLSVKKFKDELFLRYSLKN